MSKKALQPVYRKILGKRVALIGNAESIFGQGHGSEIDNHDVVIRLNLGAIVDPNDQGNKTDILGFSFPLTPAWVNENLGEPMLIWATPKKREDTAYFESFGRTVYFYPNARWRALCRHLGKARPSTGLMIIDLVKAMKPQQLNLFGFDFKNTKTYYLKEDHAGSHAWGKEQELATRLVSECNGDIY